MDAPFTGWRTWPNRALVIVYFTPRQSLEINMNNTPDDPHKQPRRRPERSLPGGGSLTLVRPPDSHEHFLNAMDLRRGSVGKSMDEDAAIELFEIAAEKGHLGASAALALLCEGKVPQEVCKQHFDLSLIHI